MRFTVSSNTLGSRLSQLARVISSKNSMPILESFLFEITGNELTVTASDSENTMSSKIELEECNEDGVFCISSRTLIDAIKELPEQPVTIDVNMETYNMNIIYMNGIYRVMAQSAEEYPRALRLQDGATQFTVASETLATNITRSLFATAQDELRPVMNGLYFDLKPEGLTVVASDGHKLVRNICFDIKSEEPTAFILPKKPATLLKNVLAKDDNEVVVRFDNRNAEIIFAEGTLLCRLIEGRYPNYNSVIPQNNPYKMTVDRKAFISALRRVLPFSSDSSQLIRLRLESSRLEISAEDIDFATSAKEEIICDYQGNAMSIGFKGTTMSEVLNNLDSEDIIMELADPARAGLVFPSVQPEGEDVLMLLMPMLLND